MKTNNNILIERRKPGRRIHSKTPVETRPTNDFGGAMRNQERTPPEVSLFKTYYTGALKR